MDNVVLQTYDIYNTVHSTARIDQQMHARIQRGWQGVRTHPPLKNYKNIGFLSNTGPDPLKLTKLPSQHSMLGHHRHASETPFNGVSLAGRWWPVYICIWIIHSLHQQKKNVNVRPPLTKLSGSAHEKYPSGWLSCLIMLSWTLLAELVHYGKFSLGYFVTEAFVYLLAMLRPNMISINNSTGHSKRALNTFLGTWLCDYLMWPCLLDLHTVEKSKGCKNRLTLTGSEFLEVSDLKLDRRNGVSINK